MYLASSKMFYFAMRKILLLIVCTICSLVSYEQTFTLNIATVDTAYVKYSNTLKSLDTFVVHQQTLGSAPAPSTYYSTTSGYNTYVTSLHVFDSSLTALQDSIVIYTDTLAVKTTSILNALGLGYTFGEACNQWIEVQCPEYPSAWLGYGCNNLQLIISYSQPTYIFAKQ